MSTEDTLGPARAAWISDQEREQWQAACDDVLQQPGQWPPDAPIVVLAQAAARLLAENAALRAQVLPPPGPYDPAHETPIALWDGIRWLTELPTRLVATQPSLPDPTAPQQLGLLEDGA